MKTEIENSNVTLHSPWRQSVNYEKGAAQAKAMGQSIQRDTLSELCEGVSEYFLARAYGLVTPRGLERLLPLLISEAAQEIRHSPSTPAERKVLRALRLLWASLWRGPRCQALAERAGKYV